MDHETFSRSKVMEMVKEKIKLARIGQVQDTDDILDFIQKQDPQNHALQTYVILRTVLEKSPRVFDPSISLKFRDKFKTIKADAEKANNHEGKEVWGVLERYFNGGGSKIFISVDANSIKALSFLIAMGEPCTALALAAAAQKQNIEAVKILLAAGCPTHNPDDPITRQPIFFAFNTKNETLIATLIPYVDLSIKFTGIHQKLLTLQEYYEDPIHKAKYVAERALLTNYSRQKLS